MDPISRRRRHCDTLTPDPISRRRRQKTYRTLSPQSALNSAIASQAHSAAFQSGTRIATSTSTSKPVLRAAQACVSPQAHEISSR
eukprot:scaffold216861_cov31-Prasinocladus_malaysianus.AAC.1